MSCLRALVLPGLAWCCLAPFAPGAEASRLRVVTSFLPVYCFTVNITRDLAEVENLLPAQIEPHEYQFSRRDLQKLSRADLLVVNGLGLERWLDKALAVCKQLKTVEMAAGLNSELIYPSGNALPNPHIWLDPLLARHAVSNILQALQKADPSHAPGYASNAVRYLARLEKLDGALREELASVRGAPIVTYHDAFAYFARSYGLELAGVVEPVPEVEPSLKSLAALYRMIRERHVKVLLFEPPAATRLAKQIASDLGLRLAPLETLEAGPLQPGAYEQGMERNGRILMQHLARNLSDNHCLDRPAVLPLSKGEGRGEGKQIGLRAPAL